MDFKRKGWLKKYLEFRKENPLPETLPTSGINLDKNKNKLDEEIYCFLQPTGLLYGFPFDTPFDDELYPKLKYYDSGEKAQLVFIESLFAILYADRNKLTDTEKKDKDQLFEKTADHAINFFEKQHKPKKKRGLFGKIGKAISDPYLVVEESIRSRVQFNLKPSDFTSYFHNSLLFLDLYFCLVQQRVSTSSKNVFVDKELSDEERQINLRTTLLELIIAAAHANNSIEKQEEKIFEQFVFSANLPEEVEKEIRTKFNDGLKLEDIEIPESPWLVRRYFLELCILTVMSDHTVDAEEHQFIDDLSVKLNITDQELEESFTALECFLHSHEKQLRLLKSRPKIADFSSRIQDRMQKAVLINQDRLKLELQESKELYALLKKSRKEELTPEEKEKVRLQLIDLLKTVPLFVIIALPGTFMTLPILLKVLPSSFYPTAFQEDQ